MELEGKVALITGGSQGIGRAYCEALASEGVKVAICDIKREEGSNFANELNSAERRAIFLYCDVTNNAEIEGCFKKVLSEFGRLDIVVNNAGILNDNPEEWEKEVDVNLCGVIRGTLLGLKYLKNGGTIVATSSLAGIIRDSIFPIYSATKGGVNYFVRSIGAPNIFSLTGIRVVAIAPALTETNITQQLLGNNTINPALRTFAEKRNQGMYKQKPESIAACLIHVLKKAPSGSVWLVERDNWREIDYDRLIQ